MQYRGFMMFNCEFSLFPSILPLQQIQLIFNSVTRDKPFDPTVPTGIDYTEFKEALLRIAIKRKEVFDKIYDKVSEGMKQSSMKGLLQDMNKGTSDTDLTEQQQEAAKETANIDENDVDHNAEDTYHKVSDTRIQTMEGLMYYLDLPQEKQALFNKLNLLKKNAKYVPPRDRKKVWITKLEQPQDQRDDAKGNATGRGNNGKTMNNSKSPAKVSQPDSPRANGDSDANNHSKVEGT